MSLLRQYNISLTDLLYENQNGRIANFSWIDIYHQVSYIIGTDFNMTFDLNDWKETVKISDNILNKKSSNLIHFQKLYTVWSGLCYMIVLKVKTQVKNYLGWAQLIIFISYGNCICPSYEIALCYEI